MPHLKRNAGICVHLTRRNRTRMHNYACLHSKPCKPWFNQTTPALHLLGTKKKAKVCWNSAKTVHRQTGIMLFRRVRCAGSGGMFITVRAHQQQRNEDAIKMTQHLGESTLFSCRKMEQDDTAVAATPAFLNLLAFSSKTTALPFYPECGL